MNKIIPKKAFYSASVFTSILVTLMLSGCGAEQEKIAKVKSNTEHLSTFLSLHSQFCEQKYISSSSLKSTLQKAADLKKATNFEGVYEVTIDQVSFAVSPEEDGCTTDVMLKGQNNLLFTFEDINEALLSQGYIETSEAVSRKDLGIDESELTIIEKKYISPSGEVTILDFPLEKKDKYYMTLFAEKFAGEKHKKKEKFIQSLKMAAL